MDETIEPMEAQSADELPAGEGLWYEPKWDGFRCLAAKASGAVRLQAKSGKPLGRYFPEVCERLARAPVDDFVVDGELLIEPGGFEALQLRLHPAESRVRRLAGESPARLMLFDLLVAPGGRMLGDRPFAERRDAVAAFVAALADPMIALTEGTEDLAQARAWLVDPAREGVVAKRLDAPYRPGERAMVKVKRARTADCVVGGFRHGKDGLVGALLLGLYDPAGRLNHVGHCSGFAGIDRAALTAQLEALAGGEGFTGSAPGGPSRWSSARDTAFVPLRPELVVEAAYDQVSGGRFRHGVRLVRFRPDKAPRQCLCDQLGA